MKQQQSSANQMMHAKGGFNLDKRGQISGRFDQSTLRANFILRIKFGLKNIVSSNLFLRKIFVVIFNVTGRVPWSFSYGAYKMDYIENVLKGSLTSILNNNLPSGYASRIDERAVEYPWVLAQLKEEDKTILDAGSSLNHDYILGSRLLKGKELYISTLAFEGRSSLIPKQNYTYEDLRKTAYKNNFFDAVVCISTLEHVGLDNTFLYTQDLAKKENNRYEFLKAVAEFKRILKEKGRLFITVPYGKYKNHGWFQIFDEAMVESVIKEFNPASFNEAYFMYRNDQWNRADKKGCQESRYYDIHTERYTVGSPAASESIVCLELTK